MLSFDTIRQFVRAHPGKTLLVVIAAVLYAKINPTKNQPDGLISFKPPS